MTIALHAPNEVDAVRSLFECSEEMNDIHLSGAGDPDNSDVGRISQSHGTCQVRSGIPSEITAKSNDNRFEFCRHRTPSNKASTLHMI